MKRRGELHSGVFIKPNLVCACKERTLAYIKDLDGYFTKLVNSRNKKALLDGRIAQHRYPELKAFKGLDNVIRWCASGVNDKVDQIEFVVENDVVHASLYLVEVGVKLYSDPPLIKIGQNVLQGFGIEPHALLDEQLDGLPQPMVKLVHQHLKSHRPVYW